MKRFLSAAALGALVAGMGTLEAADSPSLETCVRYAEVGFASETAADRSAGYLAVYTETNKVQSDVPEVIEVLINRDLKQCRESQPDLFGAVRDRLTAALSPKCHELPGSYPASGDDHAFAQCWQQVDERPDCFVHREHFHSGDSVRMSGEWECPGGVTGGVVERGTATIESGESVDEGPVVDGKRNGDWVLRRANGTEWEGPFVDGKMNGDWVGDFGSGYVWEGPFVDGKANGHWVLRFADGTVWEGPFVDDKRNGHWVLRFADGQVQEGPFVDDKRNGHWVTRFADGQVDEGPFVDDKRNGHWVERRADGDVEEGSYVDGERAGQWVKRYVFADGSTVEVCFHPPARGGVSCN